MILGVLGGSGLYDIDGLVDARSVEVSTPFGPPSGPLRSGRIGEARLLFLPQARGRASPLAVGDQLPGECLRAQGGGGDAGAVGLGGRLAARGDAAGRPRAGRSVHRQDLPAGLHLLRRRRGRTRLLRRADLRGVQRRGGGGGGRDGRARGPGRRAPRVPRAGGWQAAAPGRHLRLHGGAAVLHPRRVAAAPELGRRSHRHDRGDRGEALPRGGALLRLAGAGHRLRLLARRGGGGHGRRRSSRCWRPTSPAPRRSCVVCRPTPSFAADCGCARAAAHAILTAPEAITPEARQRLRALHGRES